MKVSGFQFLSGGLQGERCPKQSQSNLLGLWQYCGIPSEIICIKPCSLRSNIVCPPFMDPINILPRWGAQVLLVKNGLLIIYQWSVYIYIVQVYHNNYNNYIKYPCFLVESNLSLIKSLFGYNETALALTKAPAWRGRRPCPPLDLPVPLAPRHPRSLDAVARSPQHQVMSKTWRRLDSSTKWNNMFNMSPVVYMFFWYYLCD